MVNTAELVASIKEIRRQTGCGLLYAKEALEQASGDIDLAVQLVNIKMNSRPKGVKHAAVFHYNHNNRIAAIVKIACETDFVCKMADFKQLGNDIAQQIVGTGPQSIDELLSQEFIKDTSVKIQDMIDDLANKTQEKIVIVEFFRSE